MLGEYQEGTDSSKFTYEALVLVSRSEMGERIDPSTESKVRKRGHKTTDLTAPREDFAALAGRRGPPLMHSHAPPHVRPTYQC